MLGAIVLTSFFIIDGDTIASDTNRIRLWGIDAPELYTQDGRDSRAFLEEYLHNQTLNCYSMGEDGYGRTVARCFDSYNVDVACALIYAGHAHEWNYFSGGFYTECRP